MKRAFYFLIVLVSVAVGVHGQDPVLTASTSTIDGARYEMIQSPITSGLTFRLDKYTGVVDRLGTCPKDDGYGSKLCWKEMIVLELSKSVPTSKPHYQIVVTVSGTTRTTMLLNIDTGKTWQFGIDPQDRWFPFVDCSDKANSNCLWRPI